MTEYTYQDANGRPLIGPCDTPGCRYASLPGGGRHAGRCSTVRTTITVHGSVGGDLYWPTGAPAWKSFEYREEAPTTIRDVAESIVTREGGDFSTAARMMADTVLTITRWRTTGQRSRTWALSRFASIAGEYCSPDWPEYDDGEV